MQARVTDLGLRALSYALLVLMGLIVLQVLFSAVDLNPVATFQAAWPLLGKAITLNSLLDAQWHLLVIIGLMPAGLVWLMDRHVRVDFFYQRRALRWQARTNLLGNLAFAAPFFVMALQASWNFAARAWASDEGSRNAGLNDLWLIKAVLPIGLALLALAVLIETVRLIRDAR
ncbi:TRAP transporter small permease subunit [Candidatus Rhodobacter oscarellae]|uniref:TRAP transporter small permease subunit n=1 Tax=Candidatus Rhodobacter oscarellae TaxID=1675527 RepID=UPI001364B1A4|nr:TRAP transporter small permease subunit [Candidatus Rhodobacter lobularis]